MAEQIASLRSQVNRIQYRLSGPTLSDPANFARLVDGKARLIAVCLKRRSELESLATDGGLSPATASAWSRLASIKRRCAALAADCAALEQRVHGDERIAAAAGAADSLAEYFSSKAAVPRSHYAALSDAEHYGADASSIHLSYARLEVWNLDRAVHEFGHLWAQEYASGPMGAQTAYLRTLGKPWNESQGKELYADAVAVYLTGPAVAYSSLTLDFSPADRFGSDDHPSDDDRACSILGALDALSSDVTQVTQAQFRGLTADLALRWSAAREAAGATEPAAHGDDLKYAAGIAVAGLKTAIPHAQFRSLSLANQVSSALKTSPNALPDNAQGPDILNGAWLARLDRPGKEEEISQNAMAMFSQLRRVHS